MTTKEKEIKEEIEEVVEGEQAIPVEKPIEEAREFVDIPYDAQRRIDKVWLGEIIGTTKIRAYRNAVQEITKNVWTKIQLNVEVYDDQGEFDNVTNYRFTATKPGYYLVSMATQWEDPEDGKRWSLGIYKNGSIYSESTLCFASTTQDHGGSHTDVVKIDAGDYIEFWVWASVTAATLTLDGVGQNMTYMSVHKIS